MTYRCKTLIAIAVYSAFCISFLIIGIAKLDWDWDVLAYVAETLEKQPRATADSVHRDTYDLVRSRVSNDEWRMLTMANDYRVEQAQNANAFMSMLGMYRIKLGYRDGAPGPLHRDRSSGRHAFH